MGGTLVSSWGRAADGGFSGRPRGAPRLRGARRRGRDRSRECPPLGTFLALGGLVALLPAPAVGPLTEPHRRDMSPRGSRIPARRLRVAGRRQQRPGGV